MKLGDVFKKPQIEDDENINPRTLRGRMGDKIPKLRNAPVAPFGAGTSGAPFVPDWTPFLTPAPLGAIPLTCPSTSLYRYSRASLITQTNVTSYFYLTTTSQGNVSSTIGFLNIYVKVWPASPTSPIAAQVFNNTPPDTFLGGGFVLAQYSIAPPATTPVWTIAVNPGEWISFCYEITQPWATGSSNQKNVILRFSQSPILPGTIATGTSNIAFEYPTGCTWAPALATPSPSPNWSNPNGTYA
jgi:hypothetical protein